MHRDQRAEIGVDAGLHLLARLRDRADADVAPACDVDPQFGDVCGVDARQIGGVFQQELAAPERMVHPRAAELLHEHAEREVLNPNALEHGRGNPETRIWR